MKSAPPSTASAEQPAPGKSRTPVSRRLVRGCLVLLALPFVLALLGGAYQAVATALDQRNHPPSGELVDVGGYRLHLYCSRANVDGSPTVILEQGLGGISSGWAWVQPEVARETCVCSYDRAGMGWSDPGSEPRDAQNIARELQTLLRNAEIPGPYVLVGWSYGGLYVRAYAGLYGEQVAGLVLLDSSHPDQWTGTPEEQAQFESNANVYSVAPALARLGVMRFMGLLQPASGLPGEQDQALKASFAAAKDWDAQSAEFLAWPATAAQVRESELPEDIPVFVLTASEHGLPPEQEQLWQNRQSELASLSNNTVHRIVPGADHASFWRDPETAKASSAAILAVLEAARTGNSLE